MAVDLNINGKRQSVDVDPSTPLLWVLRDNLGMTGTKYGCGIAQCGACTVHIDGVATRSCQVPAQAAANKQITTIEGLSKDTNHPLQKVWIEGNVAQCGYCQSGMLMAAAALQALLPDVVRDANLQRAIAVSSVTMQLTLVIAPILGGLAYAENASWAYALGAVLFDVAALAMLLLSTRSKSVRPSGHELPAQSTPGSILAGLRHVWRTPMLAGALSLDLVVVILGGATVLLPVFAQDLLSAGPGGLGMLRAAPGAGAILVSLWIAIHPLDRAVGRKMFTASAIYGLATVILGVAESFALALVALAVLGAADTLAAVIRATLLQLETPESMRGRVAAVNSLVVGSSNQLGDVEASLVASWLGSRQAVVLGGFGVLVACAAWVRLFPALYRRDRL